MVLPSEYINNRLDRVNTAAEIFAMHGDFIRNIIRYHVKNENQIDDLFQDFFISLVSKPIPSDVKNIKSYLYRAITHDIIDSTRRVEKYQNHIHKYAKRINDPINKKTPESAFIETEETNKMFELIEMRLRRSEAQAITLRYRNNYDIKAVANKMNVDRASVRRYISVGLSKIRQFLTGN